MTQTSNPTRNITDMLQAWTPFQRGLWDNWMGLSQTWPPQGSESLFPQPLDWYESAVHAGLDIQAEWARNWLQCCYPIREAGAAFAQEWFDEATDMIAACDSAQRHAWNATFAAARGQRSADRTTGSTAHHTDSVANSALGTWQDIAEQGLAMQTQWMSVMASLLPGAPTEQSAKSHDSEPANTEPLSGNGAHSVPKKARGRPRKQGGSGVSAQPKKRST